MQMQPVITPTLAPGEAGLPSTDRLLLGVQATLQKIAAHVRDEQSRTELSSIDAVLSELARRNQTAFYVDYYRDIRQLLIEGSALLKNVVRPELLAPITADIQTSLPQELSPDASWESKSTVIHRVLRHLASMVKATPSDQSNEIADFLKRVVAKENDFYVERLRFAKSRQWTKENKPPLTAETLETYLRQREPQRMGLRVKSFKQLVGGFQKTTVLFETEDDSGRKESSVLRAEKDDKFVALDATDIRKEYAIVKFVHDAGIRVAEPFWLEEDESKLGNRFFVSQRVAGENIGTAVSAVGITDDIARSFVEEISKVHGIPVSDAMRQLAIGRWLDHDSSEANTRAAIRYWSSQPLLEFATPSPLTERVTRWLTDNVPQGDIPQCLIHCDYGPHNTLVHDGKVAGILDWESARVGDPAEDISWFLQSCGEQVNREKVIDWYQELTGHRISEFQLRYYDVMACLKIMVSHSAAEVMYEKYPDASIVWMTIPLCFTSYGSAPLEERIRLAEAARGR